MQVIGWQGNTMKFLLQINSYCNVFGWVFCLLSIIRYVYFVERLHLLTVLLCPVTKWCRPPSTPWRPSVAVCPSRRQPPLRNSRQWKESSHRAWRLRVLLHRLQQKRLKVQKRLEMSVFTCISAHLVAGSFVCFLFMIYQLLQKVEYWHFHLQYSDLLYVDLYKLSINH